MAICEQYRIPHSHFLGWDSDDRNKAIAWHVFQSEACSHCCTRAEDWDPTRGGRRDAYLAEIRDCPGCAVTESATQTLRARQEQGQAGLRLVLRPNLAGPEAIRRAEP